MTSTGPVDREVFAGDRWSKTKEGCEHAVVRVVVIDLEGRPVPGASVSGTRTDAFGRCELSLRPGQQHELDIAHERYAPARVELRRLQPGERMERWVRLYVGLPVHARVVLRDSGEPAVGARVELTSGVWTPDANSKRTGVSDEHGVVRWDNVLPGQISMQVVPPVFRGTPAFFELRADVEREEFALEAITVTRIIVGVVDEADTCAARVKLLSNAGWTPVDDETLGVAFETFLAAGEARDLEVYAEGERYGSLTVLGDKSETARHRLTVRPIWDAPNTGDVLLRVWSSETKRGILGAHVRLDLGSTPKYNARGTYASLMCDLRTDERGTLRVQDVPTGEVVFWVRADGHAPENVVSHVLPGELTREDMRLERANMVIRGHCEPPQPLEGWVDGNVSRSIDANVHGRFVYHGYLNAGELHSIHFKRPGTFHASHSISGLRVGADSVLLLFPPSGALVVRCTDPKGLPVCKALAAIKVGDEVLGSDWIEGPNGALRFPGLPVGEHEFWLARRGYEDLGPVRFEIRAGEITELSLRFARVLPVVAVTVRDDKGAPLDHCLVDILAADGKTPILLVTDELFASGLWPTHLVTTASDGRCFVPVPAQGPITVGVAWGLEFRAAVHRRVFLPAEGTVAVEFVLSENLVATEVAPGSAAYAAGLRKGDVILRWGGTAPQRPDDCVGCAVTVPVVVRRDTKEVTLELPPWTNGFTVDRKIFGR